MKKICYNKFSHYFDIHEADYTRFSYGADEDEDYEEHDNEKVDIEDICEYCSEILQNSVTLIEKDKKTREKITEVLYEIMSDVNNLSADLFGINLNESITDIKNEKYKYYVIGYDYFVGKFSEIIPILKDDIIDYCVNKYFCFEPDEYREVIVGKIINNDYFSSLVGHAFHNRIVDSIFDKDLGEVSYEQIAYDHDYSIAYDEEERDYITYLEIDFHNIYFFIKKDFIENSIFRRSTIDVLDGVIEFMAYISFLNINKLLYEYDEIELKYQDMLQFFLSLILINGYPVEEYSIDEIHEVLSNVIKDKEKEVKIRVPESLSLIQDKDFFIHIFSKALENKNVMNTLEEAYLDYTLSFMEDIKNEKGIKINIHTNDGILYKNY